MVTVATIVPFWWKVEEREGWDKRLKLEEKLKEIIRTEWSEPRRLEKALTFLKENKIPYVFHRYDNITPSQEAIKTLKGNTAEAAGRKGKGLVALDEVMDFLIPDYEEDPPEEESNLKYIFYAVIPLIALLVLKRK
jgi:hypothetical protein